MFTLNSDTGKLEPPVVLEEMCPMDCNGQGTCVEGKFDYICSLYL